MTAFRSFLFVPGDRADRFDKAVAAGADAVVIDWEDAVLPDNKGAAREATISWLEAYEGATPIGVRLNSLRTVHGCADVAAWVERGASAAFLMIPKAETGVDLQIVREALSDAAPLMAVVESPSGVAHAMDIAAHAPAGVLFGGADYAASLGADLSDWDAMLHGRSVVANAGAAAGVSAYDVPYLDVKNDEGLRAATEKARALGFAGRACIHPAQIATVNAVFTPTSAQVAEARAIIAALEQAQGGAVLHQGKLVDRPVILAAQRILAKADIEHA